MGTSHSGLSSAPPPPPAAALMDPLVGAAGSTTGATTTAAAAATTKKNHSQEEEQELRTTSWHISQSGGWGAYTAEERLYPGSGRMMKSFRVRHRESGSLAVVKTMWVVMDDENNNSNGNQ